MMSFKKTSFKMVGFDLLELELVDGSVVAKKSSGQSRFSADQIGEFFVDCKKAGEF